MLRLYNYLNKLAIPIVDTELRRSREDFIVHFKQTYSDAYPPARILA